MSETKILSKRKLLNIYTAYTGIVTILKEEGKGWTSLYSREK
ncbi:hypothetical protein ELI_1784 [Eubacterium callanderi]|uniref:Uncharacterized protein n=1 Tax=Eubacterium callanderi TaxID=53442 RepID=E3GDG5_9FIRM|nr:hypothetical protein ELI_1784 [Eubacterium callanderi]